MANTTKQARGVIEITGLDADWNYNTDGGFGVDDGIYVTEYQFIPSAVGDRMLIHEGGVDAANLFDSGLAAGTAAIHKEVKRPKFVRPIIDIADCTLDTAANAKVLIYYA
jgi:hypothetical protein